MAWGYWLKIAMIGATWRLDWGQREGKGWFCWEGLKREGRWKTVYTIQCFNETNWQTANDHQAVTGPTPFPPTWLYLALATCLVSILPYWGGLQENSTKRSSCSKMAGYMTCRFSGPTQMACSREGREQQTLTHCWHLPWDRRLHNLAQWHIVSWAEVTHNGKKLLDSEV